MGLGKLVYRMLYRDKGDSINNIFNRRRKASNKTFYRRKKDYTYKMHSLLVSLH